MAERTTINEPYARRLYKAYRDKRPDGDARRVAIGDGFHARFGDEDERCARCGAPIDTDGGGRCCRDVFGCDAALRGNRGGGMACGRHCPRHRGGGPLRMAWTLSALVLARSRTDSRLAS